MLRDLDQSVAAFLSRVLPAGTTVWIGPPAASWAAAPPVSPLLSAFLYDVREPQRPGSDAVLARDADGHPAGWQRPVRRYLVSYLLMAWPGSGGGSSELAGDGAGAPAGDSSGEHGLLGAVLTACAVAAVIPADCLHGVLAGSGEPVPLVCAGPDRVADATQLWPGLGIPPRTALDFRVVAPVVPPLLTELSPGVRSLEVGVQRTPTAQAPARKAKPDGWERRHITERA